MNNTILDGSVWATETRHDEALVYVTIAGGDRPLIILFDREDLQAIAIAHESLKQGPQACPCHITDTNAPALDFFNTDPEPDPAAVLDVLNAPKHDGRFIHDRVEYRYDTARTQWVAWGRTDIDDQDGAW